MKKKNKWYLVEFLVGQDSEWTMAKWSGSNWRDVDGDEIDYFHHRYILISDMEKNLKGKFENE